MSSYIKNYRGFINEVYGANPDRDAGDYEDHAKLTQAHVDQFPECIKGHTQMTPWLLGGAPVYHGIKYTSFDEMGEQYTMQTIYYPNFTRTAKWFNEPNPINPAAAETEDKLYKWSCDDPEFTGKTETQPNPPLQLGAQVDSDPAAIASESLVRRSKRRN